MFGSTLRIRGWYKLSAALHYGEQHASIVVSVRKMQVLILEFSVLTKQKVTATVFENLPHSAAKILQIQRLLVWPSFYRLFRGTAIVPYKENTRCVFFSFFGGG